MKHIQISHRITQPTSHHSNIHVIERVKVMLDYVQEPKHKGDASKIAHTGFYIYERMLSTWYIVEEERWMTCLEAEDVLSKYIDTGKLPDDLPAAIDGLQLPCKGESRADRKIRLDMAQKFADLYTKNCGEEEQG